MMDRVLPRSVRSFALILGVWLGLSALAGPTWAGGLVLEFGSPSYNPQGTAAELPVYLAETNGSTQLNTGLISAGFQITPNITPDPGAKVVVFHYPSGVNTTGLDLISFFPSSTTGIAQASWFLIASPPITPTPGPTGDPSVFLGGFITNLGISETTYSLSVLPGGNQFLTTNNTSLDPSISLGGTVTINSVPEPGSLVLAALFMGGAISYVTLRRVVKVRIGWPER
jgi:hypothetical protein